MTLLTLQPKTHGLCYNYDSFNYYYYYYYYYYHHHHYHHHSYN